MNKLAITNHYKCALLEQLAKPDQIDSKSTNVLPYQVQLQMHLSFIKSSIII